MKFVILSLALISAASAGLIAPGYNGYSAYPAPVIGAYHAPAVAAGPLAYSAPVVSAYHAATPVVSTYHAATPFVSTYHAAAPVPYSAPLIKSVYTGPAVGIAPVAPEAPVFRSAFAAPVVPAVNSFGYAGGYVAPSVTIEAWKKKAAA